jgi:ATP-binding protein involved in chromosome partitioning
MRTYHQLSDPDRSGLAAQIAEQRRRVTERLAGVRRLLAVMSGKGGVGKSYVTAHLARALARAGWRVGVLDADLNGPTIPILLRASSARRASGETIPSRGLDGIRYISMGEFLDDGAPLEFIPSRAEGFVWRGAMETSVLRELLGDVEWGSLDFLVLDLPPGIQRYLDLCDLLGNPPATITVTIPTPESRDAVRRAMRAAVEHGSEILGIVENMVGGELKGSAGDELAGEFAVPVLARLPWHPAAGLWDALANQLSDAPGTTRPAP